MKIKNNQAKDSISGKGAGIVDPNFFLLVASGFVFTAAILTQFAQEDAYIFQDFAKHCQSG